VASAVPLLCAAGRPALRRGGAAQEATYYYRPVTKDILPAPEQHLARSGATTTATASTTTSAACPKRKRYTYTRSIRDRHLYSPYRYQPNTRYSRPAGHRSGVWWSVGNRLPAAYYAPATRSTTAVTGCRCRPRAFRWVRRRERRLPGAFGLGQIRDALYQLFY
jgi:hypothetical protein